MPVTEVKQTWSTTSSAAVRSACGMLTPSVFAILGTHTVPLRHPHPLAACLPCSRIKARPDTALAAVVASCRA